MLSLSAPTLERSQTVQRAGTTLLASSDLITGVEYHLGLTEYSLFQLMLRDSRSSCRDRLAYSFAPLAVSWRLYPPRVRSLDGLRRPPVPGSIRQSGRRGDRRISCEAGTSLPLRGARRPGGIVRLPRSDPDEQPMVTEAQRTGHGTAQFVASESRTRSATASVLPSRPSRAVTVHDSVGVGCLHRARVRSVQARCSTSAPAAVGHPRASLRGSGLARSSARRCG